MNANIGTVDRILRAVVGVLLIWLTLNGSIGVWGWIGVVLLATSLFKFCPAYRLLGMNTCGVKKP